MAGSENEHTNSSSSGEEEEEMESTQGSDSEPESEPEKTPQKQTLTPALSSSDDSDSDDGETPAIAPVKEVEKPMSKNQSASPAVVKRPAAEIDGGDVKRARKETVIAVAAPDSVNGPRKKLFRVFPFDADADAVDRIRRRHSNHRLLPSPLRISAVNLRRGAFDHGSQLVDEERGSWPDLLIQVICDEWRKCKRAIEASSPRKEPKSILFPTKKSSTSEVMPIESSFAAGEIMYERVKVFVLLHELQIFSAAKSAGLNIIGPKLSTELNLVDAVPCRIAFERGKERHFSFLAISMGTSGWIILAEELP
nr:protein transparent testa 9 isoform X3 [Tanacetum cinerariifolium]